MVKLLGGFLSLFILGLVEIGAQETKPKTGAEALWDAIYEKNADALQEAIKNFPQYINKFDDNGNNALMSAVSSRYLPGIQILIKNGADVNVADKEGKTPIMCSPINMQMFYSRFGGRTDPETKRLEIKRMHKELAELEKEQDRIINLLLKAGANIKAVDKKGFTALHYAVMSGNPALVKKLIKSGVDVRAVDAEGATALKIAEERSEYGGDSAKTIVKILKSAK